MYKLLSFVGYALWFITWLPGLFLFAHRVGTLLPRQKFIRAFVEGLFIVSFPILAWILFVWSQMQVRVAAGGEARDIIFVFYLAQMVFPYLVCGIIMIALYLKSRSSEPIKKALPVALGLAVTPFISTLPFFNLFAAFALLFGGK